MPEDPTVAPLTVGLVLDDSLDRPDGVQQHVLTLGAWLSAQGHRVRYLAPSTKRTDLPDLRVLGSSIRVRYNGNLLSTPWPAAARRLRATLEAEHFDVLNVAMPYSPFLSGRLVARAHPGTAVVGTFHILPASRWVAVAAHGLGLLQRSHLRRFDRVLAVSVPAAGFARTAFGVACAVVANPVDVGAFARAAQDAAPRDPATEAVHLVFLGRLVERKGPAELLDAVAALHCAGGRDTPFRVTIAGRGPLAGPLRRQAAELGIGHLVDFPGYVAEDDKAALLASADLVVLPSTGGESFGISVVEALAAARGAVVVGDNPGYRSVMGDLTDQLVDPRDTAAFAAVLARFVDDADLRAAVRRRQRALAWEYDIERVGPQIVDAYRSAVAERSRSRA